ncbi:NGG1p interacting factor 3 [Pluteus cervinus]|uniref:NGG1p interacting factor 3 n=1 Tax=Pluteus cervinus TaxID=181527 RepID=A0ACD3ATN9_9AGAR|nr:NGG1p interacting factor 3 [Pluteus cervinus]
MAAPTLIRSVCNAMERIAPLRLAEKWDNVGLMLESPVQNPTRRSVLLTIDLTTSVVNEALAPNLASPPGVIVAYHPPIFKPALSSITLSNPIQASLLRCAAEGVSVFSPHTTLDCVFGGINDWLAHGVLGRSTIDVINHPEVIGRDISILGAEKRGLDGELEGGEGRLVVLPNPIKIGELERRIKAFLGLEHVQVGYAADGSVSGSGSSESIIKSVAICAGSGGSMLVGRDADVYLTGEMSHHEVLAAVASGKHVILCGHTNTERGYLPVLAKKLRDELKDLGMEVNVSKTDAHPLRIV